MNPRLLTIALTLEAVAVTAVPFKRQLPQVVTQCTQPGTVALTFVSLILTLHDAYACKFNFCTCARTTGRISIRESPLPNDPQFKGDIVELFILGVKLSKF